MRVISYLFHVKNMQWRPWNFSAYICLTFALLCAALALKLFWSIKEQLTLLSSAFLKQSYPEEKTFFDLEHNRIQSPPQHIPRRPYRTTIFIMAKNSSTASGLLSAWSHPMLQDLSKSSMQKFMNDREQYMLNVIEQGESFIPEGIISYLSTHVLESLVESETFPGVKNICQLEEESVLEWLTKKAFHNGDSINFDDLGRQVSENVHINTNETDPECRIRMLFAEYKTFLRKRNIGFIITESTPVAIQHVCSLLQPFLLRKKIKADRKFHNPELENDWRKFFQHVLRHAIACDVYVPIQSRPKKNRGDEKRKSGKYFHFAR